MRYIIYKRFNKNAICGDVNLPYGTECVVENDIICCNGKSICSIHSENAYQHFARNDDGKGLERGELTQKIQKTLSNRDENYQKRWDNIWADKLVCPKYQKFKDEDYWLWNTEFYNASISDLEYILSIITLK